MRFVKTKAEPPQFCETRPMIAAEAVLAGGQGAPLVDVTFLGDEIIDAFLK